MKKKMIAAAAVGAVLLGGTAASIYANNDGYEMYKDALKNTHTVSSASSMMEASVTDNGQTLNKMEMSTQYNLNQNLVQGSVALDTDGQREAFEIAYQDESFIIKNAEQSTYFMIKEEESKEEKKAKFEKYHNPELLKIMEQAFDALTVQVHDDFEVAENKNGQAVISVDLTTGEIPAVFREIGQYMVKKGTETHENVTMDPAKYPFLNNVLSSNVPALVDNIKIENVKVNAQLTEDNIIEKQTVYINITGEDRAGTSHKLEFKMNLQYTNINDQLVEPMSVDANKTKLIETSNWKGAHHF